MPAPTRVTVIMPVFNEVDHIERAVRSVLANGDHASLEVLVVDGMSSDGTREVVRSLEKEDGRVRLLDNPMRTVPFALNKGIAASTGEVIIRVDGHAEVATDFVQTCLQELAAHPECGCVGGAIENVSVTETAEAISLAMGSRFGVGNARFRLGGTAGYVDTLAFGAYRRDVFERVGRFDEVLTRNQDDEFNYRLTRAGYKIWLSPRIRSRYVVRAALGKLFRQYYQYGYWKVYVNRKHGTITNLRQIAPAALLVALFGMAAVAPWVPVAGMGWLLLVATYFSAALVSALVKTRRPGTVARMVAAFGLLHLGYGLGYLEGLVRFFLLGDRPGVRNVEVSR